MYAGPCAIIIGIHGQRDQVSFCTPEQRPPQYGTNPTAPQNHEDAQKRAEPERHAAFPIEGQGVPTVTVQIDEGAIGKPALAVWVVRVMAQSIGNDLQLSQPEWLLISRQNENVTLPSGGHA